MQHVFAPSDSDTPAGFVFDCALPGIRLDRCVAAHMAHMDREAPARSPAASRTQVAAWIRAGHVQVDGAVVTRPAQRLAAGARIRVTPPPVVSARPQAQALPLRVVYEDSDIIVIDKHAGMVVHPAPGHRSDTLVNALLAHCGRDLSGIGGVRRPGIVHRLDRDTSGLIAVAKHDRAHQGLAVQFAAHSASRTYRALVFGVPHPLAGTLEQPIGRHPRHRRKMAVYGLGGKPAFTRYETLVASGIVAAMLRCELRTGRTHQIRVHLSALGYPVIGDILYGSAGLCRRMVRDAGERSVALGVALRGVSRQMLHAESLRLRHPVSGSELCFCAPLPADFCAVMDHL